MEWCGDTVALMANLSSCENNEFNNKETRNVTYQSLVNSRTLARIDRANIHHNEALR